MLRNFHNLRGLSTHGGNQNPRWRSVFVALVLALVIGSAGPTSKAQAAPAGVTPLVFSMEAQKEREGPVCQGELVLISVTVDRLVDIDLDAVGGEERWYETVTGVEVNGLVQNVNIGVLSPNNNITRIDSVSDYPGAADFIFTAKKTGETIISFRGLVVTPGWFGTNYGGGAQAVTAFVHVTVIPCKFDVTAVLEFSTGFYNLTGISSDAVMIADEQGHLTGSASMSWAYSNVISGGGPCRYSMLAADSQVDLVGQLDKDGGQVMTTATFQPTTVSSTVDCGIATGTQLDSLATAHPLTFTVDSSGGVSTQTAKAEGAQGALELEGPVSGTATIVVVPEEDEAAAFSPDSRAALSPLAWWATLADNFPWLFGALLALR